MWSWLVNLRNCFGPQKRDRSPSPEPARLHPIGPLANSRHHELVPVLPRTHISGNTQLQWGQTDHPNTPGSQREQVLKPSGSEAILGPGLQGLRSRNAARVGIEGSPERNEPRSHSAYHTVQPTGFDQQPSPEFTQFGDDSLAALRIQVQPTDLGARLAEARSSAPRADANDSASLAQIPAPSVPLLSPDNAVSKPRVHIGSRVPSSGPRSEVGAVALARSAQQGTRNPRQAHLSPARRTPTPSKRQPAPSSSKLASCAITQRSSSPFPLQKGRKDNLVQQRTSSPSPSRLKRKSGKITASPAPIAPEKQTRQANSRKLQQDFSKKLEPPALSSKDEDVYRAAPRARLAIDVHSIEERQDCPLSAHQPHPKRANNIARKPRVAAQPWLPPSPAAKSKTACPRKLGKENKGSGELQLQDSRKMLSQIEEPLGPLRSPAMQLQIAPPESPASNPGSSPQKFQFMFSSNNSYGTPDIVGVHNQDEEYREDKRLKVHKTPFDIRVDRLIEKEQAYKEQAALRRRVPKVGSVQ